LIATVLVGLELNAILGGAVRPALAQDTAVLSQARDLYGSAQFDEAIAALTDAIDRGALKGHDLAVALEYLGRCQVRLDQAAQADQTFYRLMELDHGWIADPGRLSPEEMAAFKQAHDRWVADHPPAPVPTTPAPKSRKKWYLLLGGAAVAGTIAAFAAGGSGHAAAGAQALPYPPPPPN
jgi:hypothetical protein